MNRTVQTISNTGSLSQNELLDPDRETRRFDKLYPPIHFDWRAVEMPHPRERAASLQEEQLTTRLGTGTVTNRPPSKCALSAAKQLGEINGSCEGRTPRAPVAVEPQSSLGRVTM